MRSGRKNSLKPVLSFEKARAGGNLSEKFSAAEHRGWPRAGRWGHRRDARTWVTGRGCRVLEALVPVVEFVEIMAEASGPPIV